MIIERATDVRRYQLSEARFTSREVVLMIAVASGCKAGTAAIRAVLTMDEAIADAYARLAVEGARVSWGAALDALGWREEQ